MKKLCLCLDRDLLSKNRISGPVTLSNWAYKSIYNVHFLPLSYRLLSKVGVSIKDITQERAWIKNDIFSVEDVVVVSCFLFTI